MVDVEALTVAHLLTDSTVTTLTGTRIGTEIPAGQAWPKVRVFRISGPYVVGDHLERASLQIDVWADDKPAAWDVTAVTRKSVLSMWSTSHVLGVVTKVEETLGPSWLPDPETDRPHYMFGAAVYTHP
ncbi:MAG: DUF3168 domain-containing protein [Acidimicrobiia bacterium]|nr:DUF3168 domain-containing protein [Acidimicrobiia bacterium]